jgi:predicted RNase H-like HicB family nuclease
MKTGKLSLETRHATAKGKPGKVERKHKFSVLFFEHDECWAAQCLEYDIATQAKTLQELFHEVERVLVGHVAVAKELGQEPFVGIGRAPPQYWELFEKSQTQISRPVSYEPIISHTGFHPTFRVAESSAA